VTVVVVVQKLRVCVEEKRLGLRDRFSLRVEKFTGC